MSTLTDAESRQAFEKVWHDSPETGLGAESLHWGAWSEPDKADLKECAWKLWQAALESRLAVGQPVAVLLCYGEGESAVYELSGIHPAIAEIPNGRHMLVLAHPEKQE